MCTEQIPLVSIATVCLSKAIASTTAPTDDEAVFLGALETDDNS